MGGGGGAKKPTNAERNASMLASKKSNVDAAALQESIARSRNARRRSPLLGGPETGAAPAVSGVTKLGVQ